MDGARYQIQVRGQIGGRWSPWFEDMTVTVRDEGGTTITTLTGTVADQAALMGLLHKLYTLGLPLLLIRRERNESSGEWRD
jgi:hypothetical protein